MVAFAALLVLIVGGLLLGGSDDDRRSGGPEDGDEPSTTLERSTSTTRPATTTSSTSTTAVLGPILPGSSGAAVLVQSDPTGRWTWLDLDTGLLRRVEVPTEDPYNVVAARGGVVAVLGGGDAVYVPLPEGEHVELGRADLVVSSGLPDAVWLVRMGTGRELPGGTDTSAQLVGLDGSVRADLTVPQLTYPAGGTADGLVFTAGGRIYLARSEGVQQLGVGEALAVEDPFVVVVACDERAECAPEVIDIRTGRRRTVPGVGNPHQYGIGVLVSPTGEVAVTDYDGARGLSVYDASGRLAGASAGYLAELPMRWLPNGAGLVAAGQPLAIVRPDGEGGLVREVIKGVDLRPDLVFVIPG